MREIFRPHELVDRPDAMPGRIHAGSIEFDAVDFCYADGARVFRKLSVSIPAGQRVGLVGLSGSGKSTFVNLLLRLYDPQQGSVRIDGHDLRSLAQSALHGQVGIIPQDPTRLPGKLVEAFHESSAAEQTIQTARDDLPERTELRYYGRP